MNDQAMQSAGLNPQDALSLLMAIKDQATYDQARAIAIKLEPALAQFLPAQYDPAVIQQLIQLIKADFPNVQPAQQQAPQQSQQAQQAPQQGFGAALGGGNG